MEGIHHVGVAVTDLDEAIATYEPSSRLVLEHREPLVEQGVEAASLLVGAGRVELVTPTGEDTPVGRFLARRGPGMHHVAFEAGTFSDARPVGGRGRAARRPSRASVSSGSSSCSSIRIPFTAFSRRWLRVADDFVRIEIGLDGGQILSARVDDRERRGARRRCPVVLGRRHGRARRPRTALMVLVLARVLYVKRFARETRAGFDA